MSSWISVLNLLRANDGSGELKGDNGKMIYAPEGFAQGDLTLINNTEMNYHTSRFFERESAFEVRCDDPVFAIK